MQLRLQKGKRIGIFGLGLTGISVYEALSGIAGKILCYDDSEKNTKQFAAKFGNDNILPLTDESWKKLDKLIISPGIPRTHPVFLFAEEHNIQISSDIELFYEENFDSEFIVITGTNGKSTTTALVSHILQEAGLDYFTGGNIGVPVLSLPHGKKGYVLELSSFQIDLLVNFEPKITALLNITPDHLDHHGSFEEYAKVKSSILLRGGTRVISVDSQITAEIFRKLRNIGESNLIATSSINEIKEGLSFFDKTLTDNFFDKKQYSGVVNPGLLGRHNQENIVAGFAICRALGVTGEQIISSTISFKGLDHRMQYVGAKKGINFYNDSKATNASAAASSMGSLENILWLAGGRFKEKTLAPLDGVIGNITKAYLFGESKDIFADYLENKVTYQICNTMEEAFNSALRDAQDLTGERNMLLAPAASSQDQFKNFEERGRIFTELVAQVK
jgi:UDP-N-acetylmuramoylalanine--D-glutamate ligase